MKAICCSLILIEI